MLRRVLGVIFCARGAQQIRGWFGGYGLHGSMQFLIGGLHIPSGLAFLGIATEFFGGIALIVGFVTRIAAIGIAIDMLVAILMVHEQFGFFMNWFGARKGEGDEYHLLAFAICLFLSFDGP